MDHRVTPGALKERYDAATTDLDPPFAGVDLDAFRANAAVPAYRGEGQDFR
ncbi:hypothetical protein [Carbonactinospora thermoautotrophica]|uniref:hypothetical protein n=1 Tax=Carbonactinospora thermoautotrophica TaxID=1469144 RepID=UPI000AC53B51|nr:hypothetical protein [Carbonactinospora thermoautotrophica]